MLQVHKIILLLIVSAVNAHAALAASVPTSEGTVPNIRGPSFELEATSDYAMLGLTGSYLLLAWILRTKTTYYSTVFHVSYAIMTGTGLLSYVVNRDEFANKASVVERSAKLPRLTMQSVLEICFTATVHVVVQYCYDNHNVILDPFQLSSICISLSSRAHLQYLSLRLSFCPPQVPKRCPQCHL